MELSANIPRENATSYLFVASRFRDSIELGKATEKQDEIAIHENRFICHSSFTSYLVCGFSQLLRDKHYNQQFNEPLYLTDNDKPKSGYRLATKTGNCESGADFI
jgi:hypothetical protein